MLPLETTFRAETNDKILLDLYKQIDETESHLFELRAAVNRRQSELNRAKQPAGPSILDQYDAQYRLIAEGKDAFTLSQKAENERLAVAREAEQKRQREAKDTIEQKIGWTR